MGPRVAPPPVIEDAARSALVLALHGLVAASRFDTLIDISNQMPGRPGHRRVSELIRGTGKFPELHEAENLARVCDPTDVGRVRQLLHAAEAERSVIGAAPMPRMIGFAVTGTVGQFCDWKTLGVHWPIHRLSSGLDLSDRVTAGELPTYVLRETDLDPDPATGLRAVLAATADGTGPAVRLVVITGESLAGKTRTAFEAMRAELAAWRLLIPHDAASLALLMDQHPGLQHTVVWLDEIHSILIESDGVGQLRRLLAAVEGPLVLLGTLRTDRENALRGTPGWDLLDRRALRIPLMRRPRHDKFDRELARARELDDPWIRDTLDKIGSQYGIAEWLGAGPQLQRELERGRASSNPVESAAAATVDAAIDCYRAGYTAPIPEPLLREAYQLYLPTGLMPDPSVYPTALARGRHPIAGASALLIHGAGRGDQAFDYLIGHADRPDAHPVHKGIWALLLRHVTPSTLEEIAIAAHRRGQPTVAQELARRVPSARLYAQLGDERALCQLADNGDGDASSFLAGLLVERGDEAALARRADAGDGLAAMRLAELLAERADESALARRAAAGDVEAATFLASLLYERGDVEGLRERADRWDDDAASFLLDLLAERGDVEGIRERVDAGDREAPQYLAALLAERGDVEGLRELADAGDYDASRQHADLLAKNGDVKGLRERADVGDHHAASRLNDLLAERGDEVALSHRANTGDEHAARRLVDLFAERGDEVALSHRANTGDVYAETRLAALLTARGEDPSARRLSMP